MTDIQAASGLDQLPRLDGWRRTGGALGAYDALLTGVQVSVPPPLGAEMRHARHVHHCLLDPEAPTSRDELRDGLTARGIGSGVHHCSVHLLSFYREMEPTGFSVVRHSGSGR
jgi:dTDP-4-amino-4,6-dideoxygalactose transaminase